jgi:flagellar biosynthesis chaperone FliJ
VIVAELVSRCEAAVVEIKQSRVLIKTYEETLQTKEKELEEGIKLQTLSDSQIVLLHTEITQLRGSLADERKSSEEKQAALDIYKKDLAKMTKKKNFFKTMTKILLVTTVAAGSAAAVLILNPHRSRA